MAGAHDADLQLASACLAGDAAALAELERRYLALVPEYISRIDSRAEAADEVRQRLRERLLVAPAGERPKLGDYQGSGPLGAWIRVVAVRIALDLRAAAKPLASESSADEGIASDDPELEHLRARYAPQFREAFAHAVGTLSERDRTLLRLQLVDGLGIGGIGEIYRVHRATAARWLASARQELFERTRERLKGELGVSESELASIARVVQSQLDLSVCRLLRGDRS